jgi:hypothetical protein
MAVAAYSEDSSAVGIDGDSTNNDSEGSGAVYLFERQAGEWRQSHYLKASNAVSYDSFGYKLALSSDGNSLAVSTILEASLARGVNGDQTDYNDGVLGAAAPGAAYIFTRSDSTWSQQAYVKASNTDTGWETACQIICSYDNDRFGDSIDISNDGKSLVVGASWENSGDSTNQQDNSNPYTGAVYLY